MTTHASIFSSFCYSNVIPCSEQGVDTFEVSNITSCLLLKEVWVGDLTSSHGVCLQGTCASSNAAFLELLESTVSTHMTQVKSDFCVIKHPIFCHRQTCLKFFGEFSFGFYNNFIIT